MLTISSFPVSVFDNQGTDRVASPMTACGELYNQAWFGCFEKALPTLTGSVAVDPGRVEKPLELVENLQHHVN